MKAAIYIRVSTDAQFEEGYSVEAQKEQLTGYCVSKGIKEYDYYIDNTHFKSHDANKITKTKIYLKKFYPLLFHYLYLILLF